MQTLQPIRVHLREPRGERMGHSRARTGAGRVTVAHTQGIERWDGRVRAATLIVHYDTPRDVRGT